MSYEAVVCPISVRPHPNADRVQVGAACGETVIVGLDVNDGDLGVFFPVDGALSEAFCLANGLYRKHPKTGEPMGGYFESNGRVRVQTFRGVPSEGFWMPIECLKVTKANLSALRPGEVVNVLNGFMIAEKYITPATKKARSQTEGKGKHRGTAETFAVELEKHFDTKHFRRVLGTLPDGAFVTVTEKLHGTSARTGNLLVRRSPKGLKKALNRILPARLKFNDEVGYEIVNGSRNVIFDPAKPPRDNFRHEALKGVPLHKGETVFYEIVGYEQGDTPIMKHHTITDKKVAKIFGSNIEYRYGCQPGEFKVFVYRITQETAAGQTLELAWPQVVARCQALGLKTVPEVHRMVAYQDGVSTYAGLLETFDVPYAVSNVSPDQMAEGYCVRIDHEERSTIFKLKLRAFVEAEDRAKGKDDYVDAEEAA